MEPIYLMFYDFVFLFWFSLLINGIGVAFGLVLRRKKIVFRVEGELIWDAR